MRGSELCLGSDVGFYLICAEVPILLFSRKLNFNMKALDCEKRIINFRETVSVLDMLAVSVLSSNVLYC